MILKRYQYYGKNGKICWTNWFNTNLSNYKGIKQAFKQLKEEYKEI